MLYTLDLNKHSGLCTALDQYVFIYGIHLKKYQSFKLKIFTSHCTMFLVSCIKVFQAKIHLCQEKDKHK